MVADIFCEPPVNGLMMTQLAPPTATHDTVGNGVGQYQSSAW